MLVSRGAREKEGAKSQVSRLTGGGGGGGGIDDDSGRMYSCRKFMKKKGKSKRRGYVTRKRKETVSATT